MQWQTMGTFPYPIHEWDFSTPIYLLYSEVSGIVIGTCVLTDAGEQTYQFSYGTDSHRVWPTHWMALPEEPKEEDWGKKS